MAHLYQFPFLVRWLRLSYTLQPQNPSRTNRAANTTTDTGSTNDIFLPLGIRFDIDTHLTIGRTIATGNTLTSVGGDAEF